TLMAPDAALDLGVTALGADAEYDDAEEIAEIVPAAVVRHRVDRDLVGEQRDHPRDREDEAVPQAEEEPGRGRRDCVGRLRRGAGGEREGAGDDQQLLHRAGSAAVWVSAKMIA